MVSVIWKKRMRPTRRRTAGRKRTKREHYQFIGYSYRGLRSKRTKNNAKLSKKLDTPKK